MTFGDAMRNKARLSVTGSTGENGRVMTPEFPKAVHSVPYVRPDMGLNVSLTDLSWLLTDYWVPYIGFNSVGYFSFFNPLFYVFIPALYIYSRVEKEIQDGAWFCHSKTWYCCALSAVSLGGITFWRVNEGSLFLNWWQRCLCELQR